MKQRTLACPFPVEYRTTMAEVMPGIERYVHVWKPSRIAPSAIVTIVHGLGDHGGRFTPVANSLAATGLGVVAIDLVGHGYSPGRRGVVASYESMLDEVGNALYFSSRLWPTIPSFALGQSMGGNLILNWAMRRPFESKSLSGLIAMSPMLRMAKQPTPQFMRIGRWLAKHLPNLRMSAPVDARQLCSDPIGQDAYTQDRLVHTKLSMRLGISLIESGQWILDNADRIEKPTLLMHGSDDTLTCPLATEELASKCPEASLRLWPNCRHDLHYELQRESVSLYLLDWIHKTSRHQRLVSAKNALAA